MRSIVATMGPKAGTANGVDMALGSGKSPSFVGGADVLAMGG